MRRWLEIYGAAVAGVLACGLLAFLYWRRLVQTGDIEAPPAPPPPAPDVELDGEASDGEAPVIRRGRIIIQPSPDGG